MKRSVSIAILTVIVGLSTTASTQACLYIPWLDPFAWLGFYGCGGYGYGCGPQTGYGCGNYGGYGYGGGYAAPQVYTPQPIYAPSVMNYGPAPVTPNCNCTSAMPVQQQAMTAVQVPVTSYRAVTQYVPQTTYRTEYRAVQQNYAMTQPAYGAGMAYGQYPTTATYPATAYPATAYQSPYTGYYGSMYNTAALPVQPSYVAPPQVPYYGAPVVQPPTGVANPYGAGDINGDHEYPAQSAVAPPRPSIQQASYVLPPRNPTPPRAALPPRSARSYPNAVR